MSDLIGPTLRDSCFIGKPAVLTERSDNHIKVTRFI